MPNAQIPAQTIQRFPLYLRRINEIVAAGGESVSSASLAKELNLDPTMARKDLAMAGIAGTPRRGFPAVGLRDAILECLGWGSTNQAVLCGVGSLGQALLGYGGFREHNLSIVLAFDTASTLIDTKKHGVPIHDVSEIKTLVGRLGVKIGILTVPATAAQGCADLLVAAGVRGIWNFTPVELEVPADVVVQRVDLASSLALLSHEIARREAARS